MATQKKRDTRYNRDNFVRWKTGVFEETVNGVCVGYFVGWRYRFSSGARNIRAGLYFPTAEAAIKWRDDMEAGRVMLTSEVTQIA